MAFCLDCLEEDIDGIIRKADLRKVYMKYCKTHKVRGVSDKSIKITLQEYYGVVEDYITIHGMGGQEYCWRGVKFR